MESGVFKTKKTTRKTYSCRKRTRTMTSQTSIYRKLMTIEVNYLYYVKKVLKVTRHSISQKKKKNGLTGIDTSTEEKIQYSKMTQVEKNMPLITIKAINILIGQIKI